MWNGAASATARHYVARVNADGGLDHNFAIGEAIAFHIDRTDGIPVDSPPALQDWTVTDGSWKSLADMPKSKAIGS